MAQLPIEILAKHSFGKVMLYVVGVFAGLCLYYAAPNIYYFGIEDFLEKSKYAWAWLAGSVTAGPAILVTALLISFNFMRRDGIAIEVKGGFLKIYLTFPRSYALHDVVSAEAARYNTIDLHLRDGRSISLNVVTTQETNTEIANRISGLSRSGAARGVETDAALV